MRLIKSTETLSESGIRSLTAKSINNCRSIDGFDNVDIRYTINYRSDFLGNPNHVSIILENLISNGIRYQCIDTNQSYIDIFVESSKQKFTIKVLDNGLGMDSAELDTVNAGMRNNTKMKLGLYIISEIIQKCKGSIFIESVKKSGTMVMIDIPNVVNTNTKKTNPYELNNNN